ncbi:hypothetical protein NA56DRAFT_343923 [Hyaloscypha hepaticicola]|uniref:Uncharacterized protein n=1 Tax=Hyaloscypha hepaticicola TaxID=2082293 RepID=A0A2J6QJE8_9HELO|nr:hypothetical protein NA56DRAFT_343923 [Hyaloscypha hepaticicola]
MPQETPQEDATAEASVRGAPSNPVAAQTATTTSADGNLEVTDAYTSPSSAPLKRFRDRGQRRLTEKSRESIDNREWVGLIKSLESSPSVCRKRKHLHDSAIDVLGNVQKSTASRQEPGSAEEVLARAEPVTTAANEAAKDKISTPIEQRAGPTTHFASNNILDDMENKLSGPQPTMHDSAVNFLKDVRDPPRKTPSTNDNSVRHPLEAIDDSRGERDSLQPRICDSKNHGFENEAESRTPTIEDTGMEFVDDDLEPSAGPDLAYHDSAIDVSSDTPNHTFYDIMKDITGSPFRQDPIAATFNTNVRQEIRKPPTIFRKKRKERADSTGLDGDDEASSTVSSPVSRGRSRKRPLRNPTIDRLAEFPLNSAQKRKVLVSSGYSVHVEEIPSQHKFQASVSRNSQELKGGGELTAHIDDNIVNLGFSPVENSGAYAPVTERREMIPALRIPDNAVKAHNEEKPEDCEDRVLDLDFSKYLNDGQGPYDDPTPRRTQRMALVPRITISNHSHPPLAAAGPRLGSPERQKWYKLGMSLNVTDPGLKAGASSIRITQQLDGFEGVIEYKITACFPKIWPNPLNLTPEWGKVSDVDLTRSAVPFDLSTVEGWCDQFGLMHPYGNFPPSRTIKLKDLTPSDCTCCVPSQMHVQVLRDPRDSKQKNDEKFEKAWKKPLEEQGSKPEGPINVQVISKNDKGGKDNEIPNGDPIQKRQRTKYQRRPTRYNSSDTAFEYCCLDISSEEESQEESVPFRRPFQENISDYYDIDAIEPSDDEDYLVDFYTLPMTAPWLVQSESGSDDDGARDGEPNKAWTMVCESMKRNLAFSKDTSNERPSVGLTLVCESKERRFNSSEDISDYFEDPDPIDEIAEYVKDGNLEVVGDVEEEEQVMRLRGGALPEIHDEFSLDENDLAAMESLEETYPAQDVSENDGQGEVSGQNSAKRRKFGSGVGKGKVQRNGGSKVNRNRDRRQHKRQSNGNEKSKDDQQNDGNGQKDSNRESARHREANIGGEKESNSQIKNGSGHEQSNGNSAGNGQIRSNEQVEETIQADEPFGSPCRQAADRMWTENAKQNRARACRLGPECEDPYACWCEGMQEIEDSDLW